MLPPQTPRLPRNKLNLGILRVGEGKIQILQEGGWVVLGQLLSILGLLVGMRLLTETLPTAVFGGVALLIGISNLGAGVFCAPIVQAAWRFYPEAARDGQVHTLEREIRKILFPFVGGLTLLVLTCGCAYALANSLNLWTVVVIAALLPVEVYRNLEGAFLNGARQQRGLAIWNAFEAWARPLLAVWLALVLGKTAAAVLLGYLFATGTGLAAYWLIRKRSKQNLPPPSSGWVTEFRHSLRKYALPLAPLSIVGWINALGDRYIVAGLLGLSPAGIYSAAYGLVSRPFMTSAAMLTTTLRPHYMEAHANGDGGRARRLFAYWIVAATLVGLLGVALITLLKQPVANLLLGGEFRGSVALFPWLALGSAFYSLANVYEARLYAAKKTPWMLGLHSTLAVVSVATNVTGALLFGLLGVALACPVYYLVHLLLAMILTKRLGPVVNASSIREGVA